MVNWESSYIYGKRKEEVVLPIIREYFGKEIKSNNGRFAKYDYFDDETYYELKSRTNTMKLPVTLWFLRAVRCCAVLICFVSPAGLRWIDTCKSGSGCSTVR